jgi:hypothetical protein
MRRWWAGRDATYSMYAIYYCTMYSMYDMYYCTMYSTYAMYYLHRVRVTPMTASNPGPTSFFVGAADAGAWTVAVAAT